MNQTTSPDEGAVPLLDRNLYRTIKKMDKATLEGLLNDIFERGRVFDCYTPSSGVNIESTLCKELNKKTKEQAERIVLNLDSMTAEEIATIKETILRKTGINGTLRRLKELIVILPDETPGGIIDCWFLR